MERQNSNSGQFAKEASKESFADLGSVPCCLKNPDHTGFLSKTEFCLEDLPEGFQNEITFSYFQEVADRVVRLSVKRADGNTIYGSGTVFRNKSSYFILTNEHIVGSTEAVKNSKIDFFYDTVDEAGIETCYGKKFQGASKKYDRSVFSIDAVPEKILMNRTFDNNIIAVFPPYRRHLHSFTPFVISHPHGGPKTVTKGRYLDAEESYTLFYTNQTCPGSSGGLVINVGGSTMPYLVYGANPCVHTAGQRREKYNGEAVETGNVNQSVYDKSEDINKCVDWLLDIRI